MTYREQIKEFLRMAHEQLDLAEKNTGIGKRVEERLHYRLACSYLIDAVSSYNEVINLIPDCTADGHETVENNDAPDAPDYN